MPEIPSVCGCRYGSFEGWTSAGSDLDELGTVDGFPPTGAVFVELQTKRDLMLAS